MGGPEASVRTLTLPIPGPVFEYVVNPVVKGILRSPLHGLLSDSLLLIMVTGRTTGREYTTPVGYEQVDGMIYVTSQTDRRWWTNLRGGATVTVRIKGERRRGHAEVIEADDAVGEYVSGYIDRHGLENLNRLALAVDGDTVPDRETLARGLTDTVVVRIDLDEA